MMKYKWLQRNVKIKARENTKELEQRQDGGQTLINLIITAKQNTVSLYHSGKVTLQGDFTHDILCLRSDRHNLGH